MNILAKSFLIAISSISLSGCFMQAQDLNDLSDYKEEFRNQDLNVFLKSFSDHRQGQQTMLPSGEGVMYALKPQNLTNGQLLPFLGFYLYNALDKQDTTLTNQIGIDVSIRNIETLIRTGNFKTGRLGYYHTSLEARVILRDITRNDTIGSFPIIITENNARTSSTGRQPTEDMDNKVLLKMVDKLAIRLADEVLNEVSVIIDEIIEANNSKTDTVYINKETKNIGEYRSIKSSNNFRVNSIKEDDLEVSPEIIQSIEQAEQNLLNRKDQQRVLYEKKVLEQKWLDYIENQQE